ncbi:MAG: DUF2226 domain-containing protein [Candidatus Micrarchaeota archaeon]
MDIALGKPVETGSYTDQLDARRFIEKLKSQNFTGYVSVVINESAGIEEGTIIFYNGGAACADYEYYKYNEVFRGNTGLERCLNAFLARNGVVDTFSLTSYQLQLITTLNEESAVSLGDGDISAMIPDSFSERYSAQMVSKYGTGEATKQEVYKKLGISRKTAKNSTRDQLIERVSEGQKQTIKKPESVNEDRTDRLAKLLKKG